MASITKKNFSKNKIFWCGSSENFNKKGKRIISYAKFEYDNLLEFLKKKAQKFECVMSWSVVKSFENWRDLINFDDRVIKKICSF